MSQLQIKAKRPKVNGESRRYAESLLREAAFVLEMTQRVREAILNEKFESKTNIKK